MNTHDLESTAQKMVADGKGLIDIDESIIATCPRATYRSDQATNTPGRSERFLT
jgi:fructose-bisphosphate aldolase class 1